MSLLRMFPVRLADPVHLSSTGRDVTAHPVHVLGTHVTRSTAIVGSCRLWWVCLFVFGFYTTKQSKTLAQKKNGKADADIGNYVIRYR